MYNKKKGGFEKIMNFRVYYFNITNYYIDVKLSYFYLILNKL